MIYSLQALGYEPKAHPVAFLARLSRHWCSIAGEHSLPLSCDFRPEKFGRELGLIAMVNVKEDCSFSNRLVGDVVASNLTMASSSQCLNAIDNIDSRDTILSLLSKTVEEKVPVLAHGTVMTRKQVSKSFDALALPFAINKDNDKPDIILVGFKFDFCSTHLTTSQPNQNETQPH